MVAPVDQLHRFRFVDALSDAGRVLLAEGTDAHDAPAGKALIRKGEWVAGAFLVETGVLRVFEIGPTGREQTLYWVTPGEICLLGLNCIFSKMRYPAFVETDDEATRYLVVKPETFRQLFAQEPAVQQFTFDALSSRVVELTESLAEAGTLDVEQRIVNLLIRRCDDEGRVRLSQERMARHVGTAREVVSRVMRSLATRGWVQTRRGEVAITDLDALMQHLQD